MLAQLWSWLTTLLKGRPHFAVGGWDNPYLLRWYLIPRNGLCNAYLHKFLRDDDDRALHDHPWWSMSLTLRGYHEETPFGTSYVHGGRVVIRGPRFRHRIIVSRLGRPAWTLFITGPRVRTWGFWCPKGFVPWYDFVDPIDSGNIGRGCE